MPALPVVTLYTKQDCHLCGPARETLTRVQGEVPFELEVVDITGDPELLRRYGQEVPVVLVDGRKAFKGRVQAAALKKRLAKAGRGGQAETPTLESLASTPYVPPPAVVGGLVLAMAVGAGFFVQAGVRDAALGEGRIAEELLRVLPRSEPPIPFQLERMEGGKSTLDDYRGKVLFLNFWATWCPPCIEEMPSMRRLAARMTDPRFAMIAVSTDESWAPVRAFFEKEPAPFPVLLDPSGVLAKQYGTEKFPETFVIVDGQIVGHIVGPRDWDKWFAKGYLDALTMGGYDKGSR